MDRLLLKCARGMYNCIKYTTFAMFSLMIVLCIAQVVCRYVLHVSLSFTEELARFLFIWITFLGSAMVLQKGKHIRMDLLYNSLNPIMRKTFRILIILITLVICVVLFYSGVMVVKGTMIQTSAALKLPMAYVYASVPISAVFMLLFEIFAFTRGDVKAKDKTETEGERA